VDVRGEGQIEIQEQEAEIINCVSSRSLKNLEGEKKGGRLRKKRSKSKESVTLGVEKAEEYFTGQG